MFIILVAAATLGVDYGWQPRAGGGFEYIIQLEPETLDSLRRGEDVVSDIPPYLRNVRGYRITVGSGEVPRIGTPPTELSAEPQPPARSTPPPQTPAVRPTFETPKVEVTEELAEGPPPQFTPGPVIAPGQWQPRGNDSRRDQPSTDQTPAGEDPPPEPVTGAFEATEELETGPELTFPSAPTYEAPVVSRPEYEPPTTEQPSYPPPIAETDPLADETAESFEPPLDESSLAAEPPQLPIIADSRAMPASPASFEPQNESNRTAAKMSIEGEASIGVSEDADAEEAEPAEDKHLWWPLAASLVGLCLSLGGNVYLGWLTVAFRSRYRHVARRMRSLTGSSSTTAERETNLRWG